LESVSLTLNETHRNVPNDLLARSNEIVPLKVKISAKQRWVDDGIVMALFDNLSRIKFVCLFSAKVTSICFEVEKWNREWTTALEHIVGTCHGLEEFECFVNDVTFLSGYELKKANFALYPLFSNKERAGKLRKLLLSGELSSSVLDAISMNCVNIASLEMRNCDQLNDAHLIQLANRGAVLKNLKLSECGSVTDNGLIPILVRSGMRLEEIGVSGCHRVTRRTLYCLFEFCRYVQTVYYPRGGMQDMEDLMYSKCFNSEIKDF